MAEKSFVEFAEERNGKPKKDRGFLESLYKVGSQGLTQTKSAAGYADDVAAGQFDEHTSKDLAKDLIRQQNNFVPPQLEEMHHAFDDEAEDWDKAQGFFQSAGVAMDFLGEGVKQVATNPKGLAYFTAEQAGNMLPGMAATIAGAGVGAATGAAVTAPTVFGMPVGAVVGGLIGAAGRFGSSWSIESGAKLQEVVGEELANRGLQITEANIKELLNDPIFARDAVDRARGKALGTAGVDAILGGITAGVGPKVAKATTKKLLKKGALGTLEFAGEGISEAAGQMLAEGEVDPKEIALEMMGGGIGAYTTALGASAKTLGKLNKKAKAELEAEVEAEKEAKVADGNEPTSLLDDGQVEEELVTEAATEEAKEELNHSAAAIEEELQNRADDEHETHEAVKQTVADTGVDKVELNNFIGRISDSVKTAAEFTKQLVAKFGEGIKKHALKLWNMVKSERGSLSFNPTLDSEIKTKGEEWSSEQLAIREKRLKINLMKGAEETSFVVKAIRGEIAQLKEALGVVEEPVAEAQEPIQNVQEELPPTTDMPVEEPAAVSTDETLLPEAPTSEEDLNFLNETQVDARAEEDVAEFNPRDPKFKEQGGSKLYDYVLARIHAGQEKGIKNKFILSLPFDISQTKLLSYVQDAIDGKFLSRSKYNAVQHVFDQYQEAIANLPKVDQAAAAERKVAAEKKTQQEIDEKAAKANAHDEKIASTRKEQTAGKVIISRKKSKELAPEKKPHRGLKSLTETKRTIMGMINTEDNFTEDDTFPVKVLENLDKTITKVLSDPETRKDIEDQLDSYAKKDVSEDERKSKREDIYKALKAAEDEDEDAYFEYMHRESSTDQAIDKKEEFDLDTPKKKGSNKGTPKAIDAKTAHQTALQEEVTKRQMYILKSLRTLKEGVGGVQESKDAIKAADQEMQVVSKGSKPLLTIGDNNENETSLREIIGNKLVEYHNAGWNVADIVEKVKSIHNINSFQRLKELPEAFDSIDSAIEAMKTGNKNNDNISTAEYQLLEKRASDIEEARAKKEIEETAQAVRAKKKKKESELLENKQTPKDIVILKEQQRVRAIFKSYEKTVKYLDVSKHVFGEMLNQIDNVISMSGLKSTNKLNAKQLAVMIAKNLQEKNTKNKFLELSYKEQEETVKLMIVLANTIRNGERFIAGKKKLDKDTGEIVFVDKELYLAEIIDSQSEMTQLGQAVEIAMIDIINESPETYKAINVGGQYYSDIEVTYADGSKKTLALRNKKEISRLFKLKGIGKLEGVDRKNRIKELALDNVKMITSDEIKIVGVRATGRSGNASDNMAVKVKFWQEATKNRNARWGNVQEIPEVEFRRLIANKVRIELVGKPYKSKHELVANWKSEKEELPHGFLQEVFADYINKSPLGNSNIIKDLHAALKKEGSEITFDQIIAAYVEANGNEAIFKQRLNRLFEMEQSKLADEIYTGAKHVSEGDILRYVTSSMSVKEKDMFNKVLEADKKPKHEGNTLSEIGLFEQTKLNVYKQKYYNLLAAKRLEIYEKNGKLFDKDNKKVKKTVEKIIKEPVEVNIEDVVVDKASLTAHEKSLEELNGVRIVELRNKKAQAFYKKFAAGFNANLVIVTSTNFNSRYVVENGQGVVIVNVNDKTPFAKIFAHEMFHHVVNSSSKAEYATFKEEMFDLIGTNKEAQDIINNLKESGELAEEEMLAEAFAFAFTQKSFYQHMAKKVNGKSLARKILSRLLKRLHNFLAIQEHAGSFTYAGRVLLGYNQLGDMYELIHDLADSSRQNRSLQHDGTRYHTLNATTSEVRGYLAHPERWLKGAWNAVFPKGTKSYKDVMTNLEKVFVKALKVMNKMKPVGMMSDWLADIESVRLAHLISNMAEKTVSKANLKTKKYKKSVKNFVAAKQETVKTELENKEWYIEVTKDEEGNDVKLYKHRRKQPAKGATIITIDPSLAEHHKYSNDIMFFHSKKQILERMHDELVRGQIDLTKDDHVARAKALGYSDEIIEMFKTYKEISDKLFEKLKEVFPDLEMLPSHYGQSLQWFNKKGEIQGAAMDAILNPELNENVSKMKGKENLRMGKNLKMSTAEIAEEYGLTYKSIDPHEMLMDYIRNAERLINMDRLIKEGKASGQVRVFSNAQQAAMYGMEAVHDNATKIMRDLRTVQGFSLVNGDGEIFKKNDMDLVFNTEKEAQTFYDLMSKTDKANYKVEEFEQEGKSAMPYFAVYRNGELVDYFNDEKDARAEADRLDAEYGQKGTKEENYEDAINYTAKGVTVQAKTSEVARYYFHPDLAKMLNNLFAKDKIRDNKFLGVSGNSIMNLKNNMTSIEFMLSGFHFLTIGHEMITSYMSWSLLKNRQLKDNKVGFFERMKDMNPARIWDESREITALFEYALEAEGTEREGEAKAAAQKRLGQILKTDDLDVVDLVDMFFHAGGLMKQDKSLRGDIHDHAEMKYADDDEITIGEDGEAIYKGGKASKKVFMNSIKEAMEEEKTRHPNSPLLRKFNMTRFVSMEGGSAWLMEGFIPKVKMAMWAREYTMNLKKYEAEIAAGTMTHEEVARHTMKFIEDRFGEVNWRNMWMDPTIKTSLQFLFRSFTWMVGSWKALGKAGIDLGKTGWFKLKGEEYELTEKGWWGINALLVHMLTVAAINVAFTAITSLTGESDDDDEEEDVGLLTRMLFPRMDALDPSGRYTVPSYITELYKIMQHTGAIGVHAEPWKLVSGRTNSLLSNSIEAISGQDWRGVNVRNEDDGIVMDSINTLAHIFNIMPISISTIIADTNTHGFRPEVAAYGLLGMTSAPAAAKRSNAVTLAYVLRRNEHRGASVDADIMELRDDVKKAAYKFANGNRKPLIQMRMKQDITKIQFDNAIKRLPKIDGKKNPKYVDPLSAALKNLSIEGSIKVWNEMTEREKKVQRYTLVKKFQNIRKLNTRSIKKQKEIYEDMQEAGILGAM